MKCCSQWNNHRFNIVLIPRRQVCLEVLVWAEDAAQSRFFFFVFFKDSGTHTVQHYLTLLINPARPGIIKNTICQTNWKQQNTLNSGENLWSCESERRLFRKWWMDARKARGAWDISLKLFLLWCHFQRQCTSGGPTKKQPADSDACWTVNWTPICLALCRTLRGRS